jgi:hypothetical protein
LYPEIKENVKWIKTHQDELSVRARQDALERRFKNSIDGLPENSPLQDDIQAQYEQFDKLRQRSFQAERSGLAETPEARKTVGRSFDQLKQKMR